MPKHWAAATVAAMMILTLGELQAQECRPSPSLDNETRPNELRTLVRGETVATKINFCGPGDRLATEPDGALHGKFFVLMPQGGVRYVAVDVAGNGRFDTTNRASGEYTIGFVGDAIINGTRQFLSMKAQRFVVNTIDGSEAHDEVDDEKIWDTEASAWISNVRLGLSKKNVPYNGDQSYWVDYPNGYLGVAPASHSNVGAMLYAAILTPDDQVLSRIEQNAAHFVPTMAGLYRVFVWSNMRRPKATKPIGFTTMWTSFTADGAALAPIAPDFSNLTVTVSPSTVTVAGSQAVATLSQALPAGYTGVVTFQYFQDGTQPITFNAGSRDVAFVPFNVNGTVNAELTVTGPGNVVALKNVVNGVFRVQISSKVTSIALTTSAQVFKIVGGVAPTIPLNVTIVPADAKVDSVTVRLTYADNVAVDHVFPTGTLNHTVQTRPVVGSVRADLTVRSGAETYASVYPVFFRLEVDTPPVQPPSDISVTPSVPVYTYRNGVGQGTLTLTVYPLVTGCSHGGTLTYSNGSLQFVSFGPTGQTEITPYQIDGNVSGVFSASCGGNGLTYRIRSVFLVNVITTPLLTNVSVAGFPSTVPIVQGGTPPTLTFVVYSVPSGVNCSGVASLRYFNGQTQNVSFHCNVPTTVVPLAVNGSVTMTGTAITSEQTVPFNLGVVFNVVVQVVPPTLYGVTVSNFPPVINLTQGQPGPTITGMVTSNPAGLACQGTLTLQYGNGATQPIPIQCGSAFTVTLQAIPGAVTGTAAVLYNGLPANFPTGTLTTIVITSTPIIPPVTGACSVTGIGSVNDTGQMVGPNTYKAGSQIKIKLTAPGCFIRSAFVDLTKEPSTAVETANISSNWSGFQTGGIYYWTSSVSTPGRWRHTVRGSVSATAAGPTTDFSQTVVIEIVP